MRICSVEGCKRKHSAKGYCAMHYARFNLNPYARRSAFPLQVIHSEQTREKISKTLKGRSRPDLSKALKGKQHSKETKRKISKAHKGLHHSKETRKKLSEAQITYMASGKMKRKDTSIELKIEQELKNQSIPYLKQAPVEKIALVDFLLPNKTIIQCDGDYWHSLPEHIRRDGNQDFLLGFKGYKVFRFKESEIKKSSRKCILRILKGFKSEVPTIHYKVPEPKAN